MKKCERKEKKRKKKRSNDNRCQLIVSVLGSQVKKSARFSLRDKEKWGSEFEGHRKEKKRGTTGCFRL